eukprot:jgi/Botrbrau1/23081/Bobra.0243s0022.1
MEYRHLGKTGLKVSVLSYGAWVTFGNQIQVPEAKQILTACRDGGVNFFDNAEVYAKGLAEEVMGQAIKELGWDRKDYVLCTKLFWGGDGPNDKGLSRKHIIEGTRACLKRLQVEYVDVILAHRPDIQTPIEETVRAFNFLIEQGLAFYWGTSEWSAQQITEAWSVAERLNLIGPVADQVQYNLFTRERVEKEYLPLYKQYGTGLTTWSPLANGVLSGKYGSSTPIPEGSRFTLSSYKHLQEKSLAPERLETVEKLKGIAEEMGVSLAQLSLAWCISNPHVSTVIMGATKLQQIEDNIQAVQVAKMLTPEIIQRIDAIVKNKPDPPLTFK